MPAEARCVLCQTDGPLVDSAFELDGDRRVFICPDCVAGLARTARVGSKVAEALRREYESEIAAWDERLRALADQLGERERQLEALSAELQRLREAHERDAIITRQIRTLADQISA